MTAPRMAFFGSSLVSSYWNGAATYYRGLIRALHGRGWRVTFFEPDAYDRQANRDMADPDWAEVVVYSGIDEGDVQRHLDQLAGFDVLVKASGVGVFDTLLEEAIPDRRRAHQQCIFWDVDAPATIERLTTRADDPFHRQVPRYDLVLTYGGGPPVIDAYTAFGAQRCVPVYNGLDPETHHPTPHQPDFAGDISLLVNRLPDREARIDTFFFEPARRLPDKRFLLGGSGWGDKTMPANVRWLGHVRTADHNAFNCSPTTVLSVNRESMAAIGYSPATRIFEAAGAGACIVSDRWQGMADFFEPEREILVVGDAKEMTACLAELDPARARAIGAAALRRALADHTYEQRARDVEMAVGVGATS